MKKFLFSMICTLLPILASAQVQNEELTPYAVLSDDHTVLTFFYDNDKESQGGMDVGPFTSADERDWNEYCENIEQVVFVEAFAGCEAITSTRYWFQNFTNLTTIIGLGNLKTNNVTDMASMFDGCSSLTSLDLSGFETSQVTDMTYIFAGCSGLTSLDVNGFNTSNTKSMAGMFRDCSGLTSLDISAFDTSEATEMSEMFSGCSGLTSLDLGDNFNTSNVTTMNSMFSGCSNLSNLDVSGFETPEVTNMGAMFNNCSMLTSLDLGDNFNTSNVTNMEAMFSGCSNLESLDVSNFNTANVTAMGSMFGGCSKLTTLDLSGFDTSNATDLGHMFALCSGLTSLDVTGFNTSNATNMVCMFEGCSGLVSLDVSNFDTSNATNLSSMFILCSGLTSLDVSGFNTSNATDLSSMFAGCSGLTSLDVSGSFDTSNATNLSAMFEDCSSLTNLDLSGFNTANATNLSSMFIRCSGLTSLDVSNFNTANVTDMGNMFDGCSKLVSLDVSGLNTENVTNMGYMFSDCLKLTSPLDVSEFNTANVVRMDYMFNHCESLTALDVSNFNTANVTTMGSMFNYCSNLESLDVSNFNTEKVTYMAWMFADCSNLTSLDVSNFNTTNVTDMGAMFTSCSGLTELDLSNFDTSNTTTLELFFNKCSGLTSLDLSNFNTANVKNMDSMFSQCSGLETISTGNEWSTENIESGAGMFIGCTALVGGAGTTYNANHVDYTYARVDGGATNPGYFTDPNQPVPYAVLNEDNSVLTFYYDDQKAARGGMSVGPFTLNLSNKTVNSGWDEVRENIQQVVFNESFANCTTITSTSYWFYGFTNLTSIKDLENLKTDNVTDMTGMFWSCSSLTSLDVSNFNTSNVTDMDHMFATCSSLTSLELGDNFNTSNVTTMNAMFFLCESLTSLDVSGFDTSNTTNLSAMFEDCEGLTSLDVTGFDTSKAIYMSSMFWGCSSLTSLDVTGFDTSNATDLSGMFNGCSGLTSLDVSGFNTSKATTMEIMFGSCESLTSLDLSNFNTSNVTRMWKMFSGCSNLTYLNVSGFNTSNVTVMTAMFEGCSKLTNLDLSSFKTSNATAMFQMFYHCSGLETIYVGNEWSTESIESGDNMFTGCTALVGGAGTTYDENQIDFTYAHIDEGTSNPGYLSGSGQAVPYAVLNEDNTVLTFYYDDQKAKQNGMSVGPFTAAEERGWNEQKENIEKVFFVEEFANCTTITSTRCWFDGFNNLTLFLGLNNLKTDNVTDMAFMFRGCSSLNSLDLSEFNTSKVTSMGMMFWGCHSLTNLTFGENFNTSNVTSMNGMFGECSNLTNLDLSSFNTSNVTDMTITFYGCSNLNSLDLSGFNTSKVISMGMMFWGCSNLTNLTFGENFNTSNVTSMDGMFTDCSSLTSLDVTGFDTSNTTGLSAMFHGCTSLTSLDVTGFDTSNATTLNSMFGQCSNLTNLDLSSFNTSNVTDMQLMFSQCSGLETILVGNGWSTESIESGDNMFTGCTALFGGAGTTYDENHVDYAYAHIDGGTTNPGYLSGSGQAVPYAVLNEDNTVLTFYYDDQKATRGGMKIVPFDEAVDTPWYDNQTTIKKAGIDESFADYTTLPSTAEWFSGMSNLIGITGLSNLKTDNVTDMSSMFSGCSSLTALDLGSFNTKNVENMAAMFFMCSSLESLNVSSFNTQNVTNMQNLFQSCSSLTSLDVTSFDTRNVENMANMFDTCSNLTSIDLSHFNTENVKNMDYMFVHCTSLTSLDLTSFDTRNVESMNGTFSVCSGLKSLDLSNFETSKVKNTNEMFFYCENLATIYVSNGWTTANVTDSGIMFTNCLSLVGGRGTKYNSSHIDAEYAHIDGGSSNPGYLTDINAASEETWAKLQSRIEYGTDVLSKAKEISTIDQALIEKLDEALQNANQMYKIHEASEDEVLHMIEVLNERINDVEEAMNQPASEETWAELKATIEYGTDVLAKAKEISTIDQWLIEELDMTLDSGNQMYKIHEASEEEVLNMIDELNWRIKEVEEAMNQPASDEAWAELNKAVETGEKLQTEAKGVSTVEPWALEELENMTAKGSEMYKVHTAGEEEVRHMTEELNQIINEVEEMMRKQPQGEASFDGLTAYVSGNATLDDAFKSVGGRSEAAKTIAAIVWNADNALTADMLSGIDNPNLLVYVTEASKAPSGVQNVIIDGVAAEIVLTDATGNNNFYCPQSFTAKSISYSRDFSQTTEIDVCRGWETIALPFDVQSITHESHGTLVPFGGSDNGYPFWLRQLSTNGLARATKIEANRPYLICMPNNIIYPPEYNQNGTVTFSSSNVTVPVTSARSVSGAGVTFHATFQQVTKSSSVYALNVGEARGDHPEGSVFEQNYRDIRPFQAYTTHSAGTRSFITLESIGGNDDATGIEELRIKNSEFGDAEGVWYSLDGRRLDAKPTKKGVYVKDGRKIVIK